MNYTVYEEETLKKLQDMERKILKYFAGICEENNIDYYVYGGSLLGVIRHKGFIPWDDDIDVAMFRDDYERFVEAFNKKKSEKFYLVSPESEDSYFLYFPKLMMKETKFREWWADQVDFESGIFIDIFILDGLPKNKLHQKLHILRSRFLVRLLSISQLKFRGYPMFTQIVVNILHRLFKVFRITNEKLKKKTFKVFKKYNAKDTKQCFCASTVVYPPIFEKAQHWPARRAKFDGIDVSIPNKAEEILTIIYGDYMKMPPESERFNHMTSEIDFGPYDKKEINR